MAANRSRGGKGAKGAGLGGKSGSNTGGRRGTQSLSGSGASVSGMKTGARSPHSDGPKKKSTSRGMRKSTWDNLSGAQKMQEYGTTSYTKYKAGLARSRKSAGRAIEQRGGND